MQQTCDIQKVDSRKIYWKDLTSMVLPSKIIQVEVLKINRDLKPSKTVGKLHVARGVTTSSHLGRLGGTFGTGAPKAFDSYFYCIFSFLGLWVWSKMGPANLLSYLSLQAKSSSTTSTTGSRGSPSPRFDQSWRRLPISVASWQWCRWGATTESRESSTRGSVGYGSKPCPPNEHQSNW